MLRHLVAALLLAASGNARLSPFSARFPTRVPPMLENSGDPGEALFLTPYIKSGQLDKARALSRVGPLPSPPPTSPLSYSGFLTVNEKYDSNMFFWFFPALERPDAAPVLLWLQGGPGGSSLYGLFCEHGPFVVDAALRLQPRDVAWTRHYSVLYVDNPVGTGFSFTRHDAGYARTQRDVAADLYEALRQFFTLFSDFRARDFYVTGESYAGKYVPAIAYVIDQRNPSADTHINLKGVAIGDGLCDPVTMFGYADLLYQVALADERQREHVRVRTDAAVALITRKLYRDAFLVFDALLNGDLTPYPSYFYNITGSTNYFNYLLSTADDDDAHFYGYLALPATRRAVHVGALPFNNGTIVEQHLVDDMMQSVKPWVAHIMDRYKVLMYSGQLDIIVAATLTENFLWSVEWRHQRDYHRADRTWWRVNPNDTEIAGYARQVEQFYQVVIRGGGHMLPHDQPERTLDMLNRFITDSGFSN
ncbi:PREDICTED: probable serine carboxypeptidase CPVL [Priapulus caudatus]|uniref:Carboxypeptidase n=1 Tax=Priapulus caudatus TaxID=37621 RepID=A0ABM1EJ04_PRICU|nr:PREDICTED: probable serine carboxypeptidase CPVL [Priapulus caudatus]XP_014672175.1 PREDICTED: probable serine carboxypeptidase CPVL [Priapulus caudatus]